MKRHLHAIRVVKVHEPIKTLWVIDAESQNLTLDDIFRVNSIGCDYEFVQSFYAGYLTKEEFEDKYTSEMSFNWMVSE